MPDFNHKALILFDGDCGLCTGLMQFIIKRDKKNKFLFAPLQSKVGQEFLAHKGFPPNYLDSFKYVVYDKLYEKSTAGLKLLKDIGGIWQMLYLFIIIPKPVRDGFYSLVSKYRFKIFGHRNYCITPSPELRKKFLT
jgi:predicted DCC family thiol-disulfide oxidoreductase YuxK